MKSHQGFDLLVIGGSAGSLAVVLKLLPLLKESMHLAVILVFHRKPGEESTLLDVLASKTKYLIKEAEDKDELVPGTIFLAPADYHLLVEKDHTLTLDDSEKVNYSRPSIDVTFESASDVYGRSLICMLLSGANADGVQGLKSVKRTGGLVVVQDPAWAEVSFMPREAVQNVDVDILITPENIENTFSAWER